MTNMLRSQETAENRSDWNPKLRFDELLVGTDYWNKAYAPPAPADVANPTFAAKQEIEHYSRDW